MVAETQPMANPPNTPRTCSKRADVSTAAVTLRKIAHATATPTL
jgi:hypothetical protein